MEPGITASVDQRQAFADARFASGLRGRCFAEALSRETPLFGPWLLSVPQQLYSAAHDARRAGLMPLYRALLEGAVSSGLLARKFEVLERAEVKKLFSAGLLPGETGGLCDNEVQMKISKAALSAIQELGPLVLKLKDQTRSARENIYDHLMQAACDVERKRRKLACGLDTGETNGTGSPGEMQEELDTTDLLRQITEPRIEASNENDRQFLFEMADWLEASMALEREGRNWLAATETLGRAAEKVDKLWNQLRNMSVLAGDRASGNDPWYELIEYETFALCRR